METRILEGKEVSIGIKDELRPDYIIGRALGMKKGAMTQ